GLDLSLLHELVEPWRGKDDHIDRLAARETIRYRIRRRAQRRAETADHFYLCVALELRRQLLVGFSEATGGDDTDFLRERRGCDQQHHRGQDRGSEGANHFRPIRGGAPLC